MVFKVFLSDGGSLSDLFFINELKFKMKFLLIGIVLIFSSGCVATNYNMSDDDLSDREHISEGSITEGEEKPVTEEVVNTQVPEEIVNTQVPEKVKISEFVLGPGDEIEVNVYRNPDLTGKYMIPPDGLISFPLLGEIKVAGIGITELRKTITSGLSNFLVEPYVSIGVLSIRSQKLYVLGEVEKPGVFQINSPINIIEAVSMAGGLTVDAQKNSLLLIRGGLNSPQLTTINLKKTLEQGDLSENITLIGGDIVYVPATYITSVDRFFVHLRNIISPIVLLESGIIMAPQVGDVLRGERPKGVTNTLEVKPTTITIEPIIP